MKLILVFLLLLGCAKQNENIESISYQLTREWIYASAVENIKAEGVEITRPPGVEQLIFSLIIPDQGGLLNRRHCVYYQVPYKETPGKLIVVKGEGIEACPDNSSDRGYVGINDITKLSVDTAHFQLLLRFKHQQKNRELLIPLLNVSSGYVHQKYQSLKEKKRTEGLSLLRLSEESFDYSTNRYLGKLSDRFSNGSAIRCHQVTKNCETVGENRCDQCRYGWYEVVDFQCPQGGSKFCGQNRCGEKNEPACPRGDKVIDPEEAGICQNDLEPVLNADKILVCQ